MLDVFITLGAALGFRAALFDNLVAVSWWTAAGVALLAGLSTMLGHVAILKLNRIVGFHLVTSMLLNVMLLAGLYVAQAAVIWGVGSLVMPQPIPLLHLVKVALLALAPLVLNFLTAFPHFGIGIGQLLEGWSYVILWFGVSKVFGLNWYTALAITLAGWIVMQLLSRLVNRPLAWLLSRMWTLATGRPTMVTSRDILAGTPFIPIGQQEGRVSA